MMLCPIFKSLVTKSSAVEAKLMELQEDFGIKMRYKSLFTIQFLNHVPEIKYSKAREISMWLISVFSTIYYRESLCPVMNIVKSKYHAIFTQKHLTELIHTVLQHIDQIFNNS